ncbi:peptide ABC transporter periplasmic protein [Acetobacter senegalensis]|uniref:Peptide ABC transporter periplasmic protein n=2 Tax=Acetobacter senegalensis TaxID=446692 RepID=A0A0U5ETF7_9PROT|nr:peptide ABC transporter periplasmic protein [Acetobacter senegalensis]
MIQRRFISHNARASGSPVRFSLFSAAMGKEYGSRLGAHGRIRRVGKTTLCAITSIMLLASNGVDAASAAPASAPLPHNGGTLRLTAQSSGGTLDPQVAYMSLTRQIETPVYDTLLAYPKFSGPGALPVIANLVEQVPTPEEGGLTYRLTLRKGIRFSNGQPLGVEDVAASFRRVFKVGSPTAGPYYSHIVGADACLKDPAHCTLAGGVETDAATRSVVFHLSTPDPDFLEHLAWGHAAILPASTPAHDMGNSAPPGTGPYRITAYDPTQYLEMERNPYFQEWAHEAQPAGYPDHIRLTFGLEPESEVTAIENNQYDWMYEDVPLDRLGEVGSRYAAQVQLYTLLLYYYAALNTTLPPFNSLKARQALNYAVNRHAMVIYHGGPAVAVPLCQLLPEGAPAHQSSCAYTKGASPEHPAARWQAPDLETARRLVRESGTAGQKVTIVAPLDGRYGSMAMELRSTLAAIGYDAVVRSMTQTVQFPYVQNSDNHVQVALTGWQADYPSAGGILHTLYSCESIHPHSDNSLNMSAFCDPAIEDQMQHAATLALTDKPASAQAWAAVDRALMAQAPSVPLVQIKQVTLLSKRARNVIVTLNDEILLSQLQIQ